MFHLEPSPMKITINTNHLHPNSVSILSSKFPNPAISFSIFKNLELSAFLITGITNSLGVATATLIPINNISSRSH